MTPERYVEIDRLFQEAVELPPHERAAYLDQHCGLDADLRREVESLLAHDAAGDTSLERVVRRESAALLEDAADPERFGPYRVTGIVGRGGMGVVYLAVRDDDVYRKQVAIKLVKRGMDTDFVLRRFKGERRILARLEHPNIAALLDGGSTDDGRPYFVMEYVQGQPITEYCAQHRLPVRRRLELFLAVCAAVHHAHQNLVVHRDLKPTNILVTADGTVKLLDFGIAKVLEPGADGSVEQTMAGIRMMTPGYASPEQVLGRPVTTASDVYSLGAVLYEVLSGKPAHPLAGTTLQEVERVVCEALPARPSTAAPREHARALSGDADNIVLMALRKEPERRYATADQLAEDIRRTLANRPVSARADTLTYRAGRFVRRNRLSVTAAALVTLSLVAGTTVSIWQARRAERRFEQVRKLANALIYDVHDEIRDLTGSTRARQKIVATALEYLNGLEREAGGDSGLARDLAAAYQRIGDVQGGVFVSNLGDVKGALESYRRARELLERAAGPPENVARQLSVVDVKVGDALSYHGNLGAAMDAYQRARAVVEPWASGTRATPQDKEQLATVFQGMARVQGVQRDMKGALDSAQKLLLLRRSLAEADPSNAPLRDSLAGAEAEVSMALQRMAKPTEALPHAREALAIRERQAADQPNSVAIQRNLILAYSHVGDVLGNPTMPSLGDTAGAVELYRKMTAVAERVSQADASDRRARLDLSNCLLRLGSALVGTPANDEGIVHLERSAALTRDLLAAEPKNNRVRMSLAFVHYRIGEGLSERHETAPALEHLGRAISLSEEILSFDASERSAVTTLALTHSNRGLLLAAAGRREAALRDGLRAVEVLEQARSHTANTRIIASLAKAYVSMSRIYRVLGTGADDTGQRCAWLEKGRRAFLEAEAQGQLVPTEAAALERAVRDLAACRK